MCSNQLRKYDMSEYGRVNPVNHSYRITKLATSGERTRLLERLGIRVHERVVQAVIESCSGVSGVSLWRLYTWGKNAVYAGKPTIYKIKHLYDCGDLEDYARWLSFAAEIEAGGTPASMDVTRADPTRRNTMISEITGPLGTQHMPLLPMTQR